MESNFVVLAFMKQELLSRSNKLHSTVKVTEASLKIKQEIVVRDHLSIFRSYELMSWCSVCHLLSIWRQLYPLKDFFTRTTRPISTKLGREHAWGMGIQMYSNKGAGSFWSPIRGKIRKI